MENQFQFPLNRKGQDAMHLFNRSTLFFIALLFVLCILGKVSHAQTEPLTKQEKERIHRKKLRHQADSVWKKNIEITDTSAALIINRIENINTTLSNINDVIDRGYDTSEIVENLPVFDRTIRMVKYNFSNLGEGLDLNRLSLLQTRLDEMSEDLKDWQGSLLAYYTELVGLNTQIRSMAKDSSIKDLPVDTALRFLYLRQEKELQTQWRSADTVTKKTMLKIDALQSRVSTQYFELLPLQKEVKQLIRTYSKKAFGKEYGFLWEGQPAVPENKASVSSLSKSAQISGRILVYYFDNNWERILVNLIFFLAFLLWVIINIQRVKRNNPASLNRLKYNQGLPFLAAMLFMLILAPFIDLHQRPPSQYIGLLQLLLTVVITLLVANKWPRRLFGYWLMIVLLFLLHIIIGFETSATYSTRLVLLAVSVLSIFTGIKFYQELRNHREFFPRFFGFIMFLFVFMHAASIVCNVLGRVTLAQVFHNAAISGLVQATGLVVFMDVILEAVYLQLEADKKSKRFTSYLNYENVQSHLLRILTIIAGLFWFINLVQNLNLYDTVYNGVSDFLDTERNIGSASFSFGSILIFFFIVWLANILQKYIGYFFGDTGDDMLPEKKTKLGTSILLVRLLVLTAGFFLGIVASGIPLDKVTIVIGALGVGIGLGLQNIVNNLVSGVILAIERPIQVGDVIDVGSSSGRVKEISIRSTRIVTADGAEVIIPNGDMLSQKLVNWTLNNNHLRVEIDLKLADGTDMTKARSVILSSLSSNEEIMKAPEPQVLVRTISQTGLDVQVLFWAYDINKWIQVKSDMIERINAACRAEGVQVQ
jgi:potassium-dependent mechanosensitive channel